MTSHPKKEVYEILDLPHDSHLHPAFALVPAALGSLGPGARSGARSGGSREPLRLPAFLGATDRVPTLIGSRGGLNKSIRGSLSRHNPSHVYIRTDITLHCIAVHYITLQYSTVH